MTTTRRSIGGAGRRTGARLGAALLGVALLSGCTSGWDPAPVFDDLPTGRSVSTLRAVADCDELVEQSRRSLAATVDAQWAWTRSGDGNEEMATSVDEMGGSADFSGAGSGGVAQDAPVGAPSTSAPTTEPSTSRAAGGDDGAQEDGAQEDGEEPAARDVIGTNTQEAEVDEADIVKTDGRRVVALVDGVLRVVVLDDDPGLDGSLRLADGTPTEMFLRGDEVVVIGSQAEMIPFEGGTNRPGGGVTGDTGTIEPAIPAPDVMRPPFSLGTTVSIVSLADPGAPTVTGSTTIEGSYVSARMVDGRIRLIVRGEPRAAHDVMAAPDEEQARAAVRELDAESLLPRQVTGARVEPLGACEDVMVLVAGSDVDGGAGTPPSTGATSAVESSFSPMPSISTITALTIGDGLGDLQPTTIQGDAETVYASTGALYVTSSGWDEQGSHTRVHRFALPVDGPAVHTGSGRAPGTLLNQFSLSERDGVLRVVTTLDGFGGIAEDRVLRDGPIGAPGEEPAIAPAPPVSQGRLTVLDTEGDTLDEIGHLDGLGPGEQVKSVRFVEHLAYVVTFRTTDPLYALDLSDPRAPRLLGELKIPGFSEYLHPLGDGLLLGVGREADPQTGIETGFKVSLFDISDPAAMAEVDQLIVADAHSPVSDDHRAFLWDGGRRQAVVPVEAYGAPERSGAMVLRVVDGRLEQVANLHHDGFGGVPMRSFVVDDELWTLSLRGLARTSADAPGALEQLPF